jgi:cytidylate kinase|tara:strand:+ start:87 stop:782 length:696 start_codon:yes stop_codon:yes gene_type:complete
MKIHDILESQTIEEGPNDPHIFKAVFLAGGPGSGKSFVANKMLGGTGLKAIDSDMIYEYMADKQGLDLSDPEQVASDAGQEVRNHAKHLATKRRNIYLDGRLGVIIDGTGKDVNSVKTAQENLRKIGYESMMIFVNTNLQVAQERNAKRARTIPAEMVKTMWQSVQNNIMKFQQIFGASNFHVVDNSGGLEDPSRSENFEHVYKSVQKFLNNPPTARAAKAWLVTANSSKL